MKCQVLRRYLIWRSISSSSCSGYCDIVHWLIGKYTWRRRPHVKLLTFWQFSSKIIYCAIFSYSDSNLAPSTSLQSPVCVESIKEFNLFYGESRMKETDGSLSIGTGYKYFIGDIWRQTKQDYIRKLRMDNIIIIYVLIFFLNSPLTINNWRCLNWCFNITLYRKVFKPYRLNQLVLTL